MAYLMSGTGNDNPNGGEGADSDILDGGAGSDRLNGGSGADTLIYRLSDNLIGAATTDIYTGGSGIDTLRIALTASQWANYNVQAQLASYLQFLSTVSVHPQGEGANGSARDFFFTFGAARLKVQMTEKLDLYVNGTSIGDLSQPFVMGGQTTGNLVETADETPSGSAAMAAFGTLNFSDLNREDTHYATVAPMAGATGTMTASVTNAATGDGQGQVTWQYTPADAASEYLAAGQTKVETFIVTITDSSGKSATQSVTVTVTGTNDEPVISAADDSAAVTEDASTPNLTDSGKITFDDLDLIDAHSTSATAEGSNTLGGQRTAKVDPLDLATGAGSGTVNWNYSVANSATQYLVVGQAVTEAFTNRIADSRGDAVSQLITVTATNDVPVANAAVAALDEDASISGSVSASDADADETATLRYALVDPAPAGLSFNPNGSYLFDASSYGYLNVGEPLELVVAFTATDENGATSTSAKLVITITGTNDVPVASAAVAALDEDASISGSVSASDADAGETATLRYALVDPAPAGLSFNPNGSYLFDASSYGYLKVGEPLELVVAFTATDQNGATSQSAKLVITITGTNDVPVASAAVAALDEDASISGSVSASDADAGETATLRYALVDPAPAGLSFNPNGSYLFDASSYGYLKVGEPLELVVAFTATDQNGATSQSAKLVITITGTNDVPVANAAVAALDEDASISGSVSASDADAGETATLRYALVDPAPAGLSFNPNGSYSFDASSYGYLKVGEPLELVVAFTATDQNGATSQSAKLVITITGTNDVPVANAAVAALDEDASISGSVSASETATLRYALVDPAPAGLSFNPNGSYLFDASSYGYLKVGEPLELVVAFTATDENGATSMSAKLVITITGTNDVPVASAAVAALDEDASISGSVSASDADAGETATLRYALVDPAPAGLSFNPNGSYLFDASSYGYLKVGEPLELVVAFTATDENGATSTSANLVITITGTNDVPDIQLMTTDSASASLTETNAGLSTFGTLTVADADLSDTVGLSVTSIVASGATAGLGLTNAQLLAMLSVAPASSSASPVSTNNVTWTFNSGTQAFDYLAAGQLLLLTYTVHGDDGHAGIDDLTVTITIDGTTEGPVAAPPVDNSVDPNDFDSAGPGAAATLVVPDTPAINGGNIIVGTTENDTVDANAGNDFVYGYSGDDTLAGGSGTDSIYGGAGNDTIDGGQATGTIYGGSGDDFIQGGSEIDTIYGGSGNDIIQGDAASDVIVGGYGADILTGNAGDDIFRFLDTRDTGDTIIGFTSGDKIDLSNIDADPSTGNDTFAFAGNTSTLAAHAVNWFFNDNGTAVDTADDFTVIQLDSDGNVGTAEMEIHLIGTISLVAADFLL